MNKQASVRQQEDFIISLAKQVKDLRQELNQTVKAADWTNFDLISRKVANAEHDLSTQVLQKLESEGKL